MTGQVRTKAVDGAQGRGEGRRLVIMLSTSRRHGVSVDGRGREGVIGSHVDPVEDTLLCDGLAGTNRYKQGNQASSLQRREREGLMDREGRRTASRSATKIAKLAVAVDGLVGRRRNPQAMGYHAKVALNMKDIIHSLSDCVAGH